MSHVLCENCGLYFGQEKAYCKLCGHPLAGSALSAPDKICPQCHLLHGAVSTRCVFCSGELSALAQAPAPAPAAPRPAPEKRPVPLPPRAQPARPPAPVPGSWAVAPSPAPAPGPSVPDRSAAPAAPRPAPEKRPAPLPPRAQAPRPPAPAPGARPVAPSPAPAPESAVPDRAPPLVSRLRPLLSSVWMDWKILAALAVIPLVILTATLLALQPGGRKAVPARAPSVQEAAAEPERLNAEGIAAAREGRYAEAERAFLAALKADPKNPKARNNLGILYRRLGRTEEAIVMYGQAIALEPTNPVPHKNLGLIYEEQGRRAEALRHFEQYRRLRPDAPDADEIKRKIARLRRV